MALEYLQVSKHQVCKNRKPAQLLDGPRHLLPYNQVAAALIAAQTFRARDPLEHEAALGKHPAPVERAPRVARPPDPYDGPPAADEESDASPLRGGRGPSFSPPHLLLLAPPDQRLERVLRGLVVDIGLS